MSTRYTSRGQFANMLEKRARDLDELAQRIREHGGLEAAAECTGDAIDDLNRAVEKLRIPELSES